MELGSAHANAAPRGRRGGAHRAGANGAWILNLREKCRRNQASAAAGAAAAAGAGGAADMPDFPKAAGTTAGAIPDVPKAAGTAWSAAGDGA